MPNEEAAAVMRQWTSIEAGMPNVVVVQCEIECHREIDDRWGSATLASQEIPACYFTRNFSDIRSYLGDGKWRSEVQPPGPPWGKVEPPLKAMACFERNGQGVAVFSPSASHPWNFGPHGRGESDDPAAGPCIHVAPIERVKLGPKSTYRYRYRLVVGIESEIVERLDLLREKYGEETSELLSP